MSQEKINLNFDSLIFIKNIPKSNKILSIEIKRGYVSPSSILDESEFLNALDNNAKPLNPEDEILLKWSYAPWYSFAFLTSDGRYEVTLFLGGLSFMTLPNGKRGAILFNFDKK